MKFKNKYNKNIDNSIFQLFVIKKLINNLTKTGNIVSGYKILFQVFKKVKQITKKNPNIILYNIMLLQKLPIEIMDIKKSGRIYKLPFIVGMLRQFTIFLKLLTQITKENKKMSTADILVKEFVDLLKNKKKTLVIKKIENICKIIIDNQPFMHFR